MVINPASRVPKHVQAAVVIRQRIGKGQYIPGKSMPTVRMLGAELGVSSNVIYRAVRLLEKEGVVESRHGVGVRVLDTKRKARAPLRLGMVHPYLPDSIFAGSIHGFVDKALDIRRNHCVVKSSRHDVTREREIISEFVDTGTEGLLVWPCESEENAAFFAKISQRIPMVFIDRRIESVAVPSVVMDFAGLGRDVIAHLGGKGFANILILQDSLPASSYREMYSTMRETVAEIRAEHRFDFVEIATSKFAEMYPEDPIGMIDAFLPKLQTVLAAKPYDAIFSANDEFLDFVFINSPLGEQYSGVSLFSLADNMTSPRSPGFYRRSVYEWVSDFGQVITKASEILHDMIYLRNRPQRQHRVKFTTVMRGASK